MLGFLLIFSKLALTLLWFPIVLGPLWFAAYYYLCGKDSLLPSFAKKIVADGTLSGARLIKGQATGAEVRNVLVIDAVGSWLFLALFSPQTLIGLFLPMLIIVGCLYAPEFVFDEKGGEMVWLAAVGITIIAILCVWLIKPSATAGRSPSPPERNQLAERETGPTSMVAVLPTPSRIVPTMIVPEPARVISVGDRVRVVNTGGANLNVRTRPGGRIKAKLPPASIATVIDGPEHFDDYAWWKVQTHSGTTGWVAGGNAAVPWLEFVP